MRHIKIILVDDHKLVRQGVRSLLAGQPEFDVVAEASDGQEALRLIETLQPDVVIMDVMMPNMNGIEATKVIQQRGWKTRVIFLSMHANATYAVRALHSGALGYCSKTLIFLRSSSRSRTQFRVNAT